jgi:hypothetical protein
MVFIIFSQYFNFTAEIVIRAFDKLKFTDFSVPLEILALDFAATFVITLNDFTEAAVVMRLQVFVDYHG